MKRFIIIGAVAIIAVIIAKYAAQRFQIPLLKDVL